MSDLCHVCEARPVSARSDTARDISAAAMVQLVRAVGSHPAVQHIAAMSLGWSRDAAAWTRIEMAPGTAPEARQRAHREADLSRARARSFAEEAHTLVELLRDEATAPTRGGR